MNLDEYAREGLIDAVGKKNVSFDEAILEVYAYNWGMEVVNSMHGKEAIPFSTPPVAVVLPSTTEEVSKVLRTCKKHGLTFKAQSTGLGPWNNPSRDNCIIIDLRRMNHILKIDERNLFAVIEPYVSGAQLQSELMKHGLNCHMPGAGPQVSPLASSTSMSGPGFTSPSTGYSGRNVLGVEWVLPDGEVLKLGSLGLTNEPDWFCGDGPGPSLRGVMRGLHGAMSGNGVFTRVAIKVFPYPCSTEWEISGNLPDYQFKKPDHIEFYMFDCSTYKKGERVMRAIEEAEISFMCSVLSGFGAAAFFSNSIEGVIDKVTIARMRVPILVAITGRTSRQFQYRQEVMEQLISKFKLENVIGSKFTPPSISYAEAIRNNFGMHGFISTGGVRSAHGSMESIGMCMNVTKANIPLKKKYIKREQIVNDFGEAVWSTSIERGHMYNIEAMALYDQCDKHSITGVAGYCMESNELDLHKHLGIPLFVEGDELHDQFGPECSNYHEWLRKVKQILDPTCIADPGNYISPGRKKKEGET